MCDPRIANSFGQQFKPQTQAAPTFGGAPPPIDPAVQQMLDHNAILSAAQTQGTWPDGPAAEAPAPRPIEQFRPGVYSPLGLAIQRVFRPSFQTPNDPVQRGSR